MAAILVLSLLASTSTSASAHPETWTLWAHGTLPQALKSGRELTVSRVKRNAGPSFRDCSCLLPRRHQVGCGRHLSAGLDGSTKMTPVLIEHSASKSTGAR